MLTSEQIETLFIFCKRHHVHHYDIAVELVDHLANAIEDKMAVDKTISFDTALASVYAGFGVAGFAPIINKRTEALLKQYRRERWQLFRSYFTWPKIGLTAMILCLVLLPVRYFDSRILAYITSGIVICVYLFEFLSYAYVHKKAKKQSQNLLITETAGEQAQFVFYFSFFGVGLSYVNPLTTDASHISIREYLIANFLSVIFFLFVKAYCEVAAKVYDKAARQYPEIFASA